MTDELVLLPAPRRLIRLEGMFRPQPDSFLWLAGSPGDLLRAGQIAQDALATLGPRPQLTAAGDGNTAAILEIDPARVPHAEGYTLTILPDRLRVTAHDAAGAFYAAMTLRQIARQAHNGALPCLRIEDWPDFPYRGVMLDISRDRVPMMETLYALVDLLAEWKVNQFQLYTEHTFAYRNHCQVWEHASPMTGEEILALDAYCRERFIELVPNQNSFGHMARWLKFPRYAPLAEAPNGFEFPWGGRHEGPFSLCPTDPGSIRLVAELFDELLPHFSSRQFNVGCDETFELGQPGTRSKAACDEKGTGRVYLDFLLQIAEQVQRRGRTMQFWGDIIMHHPELIPELPEGAIALEWGYEANHPFDANGEKFAQSGVPFYVCPGTSSWNTVAGRTENAVGNLWNAAENGLKHGAIGYLNTDWGDNGHWQPLPVSYLGYAYGAAVSWAAQANRDLDLPRALDLHAFHDSTGVMGKLAYDLGNAYRETGHALHNSSALFQLLLWPERSLADAWLTGLTVDGLERARAYIDRVMLALPLAVLAGPDADLVVDEFKLVGELLRHACDLGIARLEAPDGATAAIPAETLAGLANAREALLEEFRRLWLARSRPGGLDDSAARLEKLLTIARGG